MIKGSNISTQDRENSLALAEVLKKGVLMSLSPERRGKPTHLQHLNQYIFSQLQYSHSSPNSHQLNFSILQATSTSPLHSLQTPSGRRLRTDFIVHMISYVDQEILSVILLPASQGIEIANMPL